MKEINLSMERKGYDGNPKRVEVMSMSYEPEPEVRVWDEPGVYLQFVEGCGYDVRVLSANEAEDLACHLLKAATESRFSFSEKANQSELNINE
jgi:hypothetical protein